MHFIKYKQSFINLDLVKIFAKDINVPAIIHIEFERGEMNLLFPNVKERDDFFDRVVKMINPL